MNSYSKSIFFFFFLHFLSAISSQAQHNCSHCQAVKHAKNKLNQELPKNINHNQRSDTFDVYHYHVVFEVLSFGPGAVVAETEVFFRSKMNGVSSISLDLLELTVDSVLVGNQPVVFQYNDTLLRIPFSQNMQMGDSSSVKVFYRGTPQSDATWGGFYFQGNYAYNLGVGFSADPHNFGRVWHPCFDNFVERATYTFEITNPANRYAHCNGSLLSDQVQGAKRTRIWEMGTPIPTYLACIAIADYATVYQQINGIPVELVASPIDTQNMKASFLNLPSAVSAFTHWFGPYEWNKIGFSAVPFNSGAMEHATNIAYPKATLNGALTYETLMAHELSHHWWGDNVTCETAEDMWINEGMASYCEHLFTEHTYGWNAYIADVKENHYNVLQNAHLAEGGYLAVSGIPHVYTYGDHVYKKGASVAHNLRWYLGDSLFRTGMTSVLDSFQFSSLNSSQLRDQLAANTGVPMQDFFNDWVFQGGFSHFEIDSFRVTQNGSQFSVQVWIRQKLLGTANLHQNTPIQLSLMDAQWRKADFRVMVSGAQTMVQVTCSFNPSIAFLNEKHRLNQARMDQQHMMRATGLYPSNTVKLTNFQISNLVDSAYFHLEYHPIAPDSFSQNPNGYKISKRRYWTVNGVWNPNLDGDFRIEPDFTLDADLYATGGLDSMVLLYRSGVGEEWAEHPDYMKFVLGSFGFIKVQTILKGDYALATGRRMTTAVANSQKNELLFKISPNPIRDMLAIQLEKEMQGHLEIYSIGGDLMQTQSLVQGVQELRISVQEWAAGSYVVMIQDKESGQWAKQVFQVLR